jgi:hypothetical protein
MSDYLIDRLRFDINRYAASTASRASISLANKWIQQCVETHKECRKHRSEMPRDWRPTRLVAIGNEETGLKLCEGDEISPSVKYATLSHCWGRIANKLMLTKENKASLYRAMPQLPQTFEDAITAAR